MNQRRGAPQTGRRFSGANLESLELRLNRLNEKRLRGDYEGRPRSSCSQSPNTCSQHCLTNTPQLEPGFATFFTAVSDKLVNTSVWCGGRTSSSYVVFKTFAGITFLFSRLNNEPIKLVGTKPSWGDQSCVVGACHSKRTL